MLYYKATAGCGVGFLLLGGSRFSMCARPSAPRLPFVLCTQLTSTQIQIGTNVRRAPLASGGGGPRGPRDTVWQSGCGGVCAVRTSYLLSFSPRHVDVHDRPRPYNPTRKRRINRLRL